MAVILDIIKSIWTMYLDWHDSAVFREPTAQGSFEKLGIKSAPIA